MLRWSGRLIVLLGTVGPLATPLAARPGQPTMPGMMPAALAIAPTEPAVLALLAQLDPHERTLSAVVTDVDRDSDLDVVAATGESIDIWINDGSGHFTRRRLLPRDILIALPGVGEETGPLPAPSIMARTTDGVRPASLVVRTSPEPAPDRSASTHVAPARPQRGPGPGRAPPLPSLLA